MLEQEVAKKHTSLTLARDSSPYASPRILTGPASRLEEPIRRLTRSILNPVVKSGHKMVEYENVDESLDALGNKLDENFLLLVAISHNSHSDVLVGMKVADKIKARYPHRIGNVHMPIAASLNRGQQGSIPQLFYSEGAIPGLAQSDIKPLYVVTPNDQEKRGLKPSRNETKTVIHAAKEENSAFVVFVEGSVEGGRRDILGHERGLQKVTNPFIPTILQIAHRQGRRIIVVSVGITGSNRMFSADYLFLTPDIFGAFFHDWVLRKTNKLAKAVMGLPYEYTGDPHNSQNVNDTIMESIASLKPLRERGYYHPATRRYQEDMRNWERQQGKKRLAALRILSAAHLVPPLGKLRQLAKQFSRIELIESQQR